MKTLLLIKDSAFQRYCANQLFLSGVVSKVYVEQGQSYDNGRSVFLKVKRNIPRLGDFLLRPDLWIHYFFKLVNNDKCFGNQDYFNQKILKSNYQAFVPDLTVEYVESINLPSVIEKIREESPELVFVFGTSIVKSRFFEAIACPKVNMHWGISPKYRGEGVISALAKEGIQAVGVTIHVLSEKIDAGDILKQSTVIVDREDNFYSVGLKITKMGTSLFAKVYNEFEVDRKLAGFKQDLSEGAVYTSKFMRKHPEIYRKAWKNLKNAYRGEPK